MSGQDVGSVLQSVLAIMVGSALGGAVGYGLLMLFRLLP
jgi:hypothetical protein